MVSKRVRDAIDFLKSYQETTMADYNYHYNTANAEIWQYQYEGKYTQRGYLAILKDGKYHFNSVYFNQDVYDYWVNRVSTENAFEKHFYSKGNTLYEKFKEWNKNENKENEQ